MNDILQTMFHIHFLAIKVLSFDKKNFPTYLTGDPISDNEQWFRYWRRTGDKQLTGPVVTHFTLTYMRHSVLMWESAQQVSSPNDSCRNYTIKIVY